jgi:RimJ/RimL family protein N-acetyltransferase
VTLLEHLSQEPARNAWPIQDLTVWRERSRLFETGLPGERDYAYALRSGHPACQTPTFILGGAPEAAADLLKKNAPPVFIVRETEEAFAPCVASRFPSSRIYPEWRMETDRASFKVAKDSARKLTPADLGAFARFNGIPPEKAGRLEMWLKGAVVFGVFDGLQLVSIASTQVRTPQVWGIAAVSTLPSHRGKGLATQATSALAAEALRNVPKAILTVLKDNAPALRVYEKLGFQRKEGRVWIDHGAGSAP